MQWNDWPPRDASLMAGYESWRDGRLSEAQSFFEERMRLQPEDADVWRGLGNVSWSRRDFVSALRYFSQALHLEPWNPMHWGNMGLARRDLGQPEAAISAFRVALGLDSLYAPALNEWANVLFDMGRYEEALPVAQRAVELCQGSTQVNPCAYALFEYARALRKTGNPQQAVSVLEERLQRFPDDQRPTVMAELRRAKRDANQG